jgi:hypothetical protein
MVMNADIPTAERLFFSGEDFAPAELARLERAFFSTLVVQNGTFKTTNHRRMDDLNQLVQKYLPAGRPLKLMDVAVSSGISTAEWLTSLRDAGIDCSMTAGDLFVDSFLISLTNGLQVLVDKTGTPIQFDVRGRAIGTPLGRRALALHPLALWTLKRAARRFEAAWRTTPPDQLARVLTKRWRMRYRPLKLVSPSLKKFSELDVVEDDILVGGRYQKCFHVVRAANILNLGYFEPDMLASMAINLRSRLLPGGILIICRTNHQNINNATVFSFDGHSRLNILARLNGGSEIEDILLKLPAAGDASRDTNEGG